MERRLKKSLRRSTNLTKIFLSLAFVIYIILPSGAIYFMSASAKSSSTPQIAEQQTASIDSHLSIPEINKPISAYEDTFTMNLVRLFDGDEEITFLTQAETIDEALKERNIDCGHDDIILPTPENILSKKAVIKVIRVNNEIEQETVDIPFDTVIKKDPLMPDTYKKVQQNGVLGTLMRKYSLEFRNGELVDRQLLGEERITEPISEIIIIGTRKHDIYSGPNSCPFWDNIIDNKTVNPEEKHWLKYMIRCESGCNTYANNANLYFGIMQFNKLTFYSTFSGKDIFNGHEQLEYSLSIYRMGAAARHTHFKGCEVRYNSLYNSN